MEGGGEWFKLVIKDITKFVVHLSVMVREVMYRHYVLAFVPVIRLGKEGVSVSSWVSRPRHVRVHSFVWSSMLSLGLCGVMRS